MFLKLGLGLGQTGGNPAPVFSSLAADGWQVTDATPVDLALSRTVVNRAGYDTAGNATTHKVNLYVTKRVREAYPTSTSNLTPVFTTDKLALNDYIYSTDSIPGAVNNSTVTSPKPVAQWVMPSRLTVSGTVDWEIVAFHRDARLGQQVACVEVRANDGTTQTAWQVVGSTSVSTICEDRNPVEVFKGTLDVSGLANDAVFWLEARVKPWFGGAASIRSTDDFSGREEFSVRYFYRNTTRVSTPPYAYVSSAGSDTTGVWSTTAATAEASPFLTVAGALAKVSAQITHADGAIIRVVDSVTMGTVSVLTAVPQYGGAITVTRAPGTARASAIVSFGSSSSATQLGVNNSLRSPLTEAAILFRDVSLNRAGASSFARSSFSSGTEIKPLFIQWWNVNFNNNSQTATYMASGGQVNDAAFGFDMTNPPSATGNATAFGVSSTNVHRIWRGFRGSMNQATFQGYAVVGCEFTAPREMTYADSTKGGLVYANKFLQVPQALFLMNPGDANTVSRMVIVQNLIEWTGTNTSFAAVQLFTTSGNSTHVIMHYNTFTGAGQAGRCNLLYDNQAKTPARTQTHTLQSFKGNIFSQPNVKGDIFAELAVSVGNYAYVHGVGCEGNWGMWQANAPTSEDPTYAGIGSVLASSSSLNDPQFTDYEASTWNGSVVTGGAGGGNYALVGGSPARGICSSLLLGRDLAGTVRSGAQPAGAYA